MKLDRRGFLRGLGSAPLAAKVAADAEIAKLGRFDTSGLQNFAPGLASNVMGDLPSNGPESHEDRIARTRDWLRITGIPDILMDKIRNDCLVVTSLDPDIASKRSWSMAVKVLTQRERNIANAVASYTTHNDYYGVRRAMSRLTGFEWPF